MPSPIKCHLDKLHKFYFSRRRKVKFLTVIKRKPNVISGVSFRDCLKHPITRIKPRLEA